MARNAETHNSDIDLLVEIDPGRSLLDIIDAKYQIENLTHRQVDIVTEAAPIPLYSPGSPSIRREIMSRDAVYLQHIQECIRKIESYAVVGREEFMKTEHWQDAIIRNFKIMGEAAKQLSDEFKEVNLGIGNK